MRGAIVIAALGLIASPALGQEGNPGGMQPGTDINASDRVFATAISQGGMAEVKLGELAGKSARSDAVKQFAKRMVSDHSKANEKFAEIAKKEGLKLPKDIDPEHKAISMNLDKLEGRKFDLQYMAAQVSDHQKTAQLLEYEIGSGQNAAIKDFASDTLPTVLSHLKMAQDVMVKLNGEASR